MSKLVSNEKATNEKATEQHHENAQNSTFEEDVQAASDALKLRGRKLTAALSFVAGTGFILFGWVNRVHSHAHLIVSEALDTTRVSCLLCSQQIRFVTRLVCRSVLANVISAVRKGLSPSRRRWPASQSCYVAKLTRSYLCGFPDTWWLH